VAESLPMLVKGAPWTKVLVASLFAIVVNASCAPFVRDANGYRKLPKDLEPAMDNHRCSNGVCSAVPVCAKLDSGTCDESYCSFSRAPGCTCYEDEIRFCEIGHVRSGAECETGVQRCENTFGFLDWTDCAPQRDCEDQSCTDSTGHSGLRHWDSPQCVPLVQTSTCTLADGSIGSQSWNVGGWGPCFRK
jgi:hypothetical protein